MSTPDDADLRLENQLCFALYCASRKVVQAYQPYLEPLGITYPQYLVLLALWEEDRLTVKALGERLLLDSGTLTPLLKRMASAGLLTREHDSTDERQRRICLTPAGTALKAEAHQLRDVLKCRLGQQMEQAAQLRDALQQLLAAMA